MHQLPTHYDEIKTRIQKQSATTHTLSPGVKVTAEQEAIRYWEHPLYWTYAFSTAFLAGYQADEGRALLSFTLFDSEFKTGTTIDLTPQNSAALFYITDSEHAEPVRGTGQIEVHVYDDTGVMKADFDFSFERNGKNNRVKGSINIGARHT